MSKPCKKCGKNDRYKSGQCRPCQIKSTKKSQQNNPERFKQRNEKWKRENPNKMATYRRRWYQNNREKQIQDALKWKRENPEMAQASYHRYRTRQAEAGGSYTATEWKALKKQYSGRCVCCGKKKKLTVDHVIPVSKGGSSDISNIQPLCRSCNSSKSDKTTDYRTKPGVLRWIQDRLF